MAYPTTLDNFTPKVDNADYVMAADVNELQSAVEALEAQVRYGSNRGKSFGVEIFASATALATGDGKLYTPPMPVTLNGYNLTSVVATVFAKSTSGTPTIQIARGRQANATTAHAFNDMLSTRITIDANEFCSLDATTPAVIDTSYDDIATGDILRFDVDTAGTAATGLWITLNFQLP